MRARWMLLLLIVLGLASWPTPGNQAEAAMRVRWGYYTGYDKATSLPSLQQHIGDLNYVSPHYGFYTDAKGSLTGSDDPDVSTLVRSSHAKLVPLIQNGPKYGDFSTFIADPTARSTLIHNLTALVTNNRYDGVNIDFEGLNASDRPYLTAFMADLYAALHPLYKLTTMAVPAKTSDTTTGWAGAYDYAALAKSADLFVIMAYDYHYSESSPGAISPIGWVKQCLQFASSQFSATKTVVGLGLYGYDWNVTTRAKARSVKFPEVMSLLSQYQGTSSYSTQDQAPSVTYQASGQSHTIWYENGQSIDAKMTAIREANVAGVAVWRLGQEDPLIWNSVRGLSMALSTQAFSPNADGSNDTVIASYRVDVQGQVEVSAFDSNGNIVRRLQTPVATEVGAHSVTWNGRDDQNMLLSEGTYWIRVTSYVGNSPVSDSLPVRLDNTLGHATLSTRYYAPDGTSPIGVGYVLTRAARVTVQIRQGTATIATLQSGVRQSAGSYSIQWNGRSSSGELATEGGYTAAVTARSILGSIAISQDFYLDRLAPSVTNVQLSTTRFFVNGATQLRWTYFISEDSSIVLSIMYRGQTVRVINVPVRGAGEYPLSWNGYVGGDFATAGTYTYTLVATDRSGRTSTAAQGSFTVAR